MRPRRAPRPPAARVVGAMLALSVSGAACGGSDDGTSAVANDGAAQYARHCASCHGADLRGTDQGPSQLSIVYEPNHHDDDAYRRAVAGGAPQHHWRYGNMPPVAGLADREVDAIIAFIRSVQEREGFEPYPP